MPLSLQALQNVVIDALEDIKGQNILVFDAQPLTSMFDRVIVVSGTSNRQTRALAKISMTKSSRRAAMSLGLRVRKQVNGCWWIWEISSCTSCSPRYGITIGSRKSGASIRLIGRPNDSLRSKKLPRAENRQRKNRSPKKHRPKSLLLRRLPPKNLRLKNPPQKA